MTERPQGETQYQEHTRLLRERGMEQLGLAAGWAYYDDPRHLVFTLARYKFVAKMLEGYENVLEIGCGDGFGSRIVAQSVGTLTGIDFDPAFVEDARRRPTDRWHISFDQHDLLGAPYPGAYDAMFSLDVLEHIEPTDENRFVGNALASLNPNGVFVIGMPSLESQAYASPQSKAGHKNCKTMPDLRSAMRRYFHNVFMFSMNDEVVHTGYHRMAHYLIAVCATRR